MLTVAETAKLLGVKEPTIRAWVAKRKLAYVKVGRAIRFSESELQRFIERNSVPALEARRGR